jgi:hypothetical protein
MGKDSQHMTGTVYGVVDGTVPHLALSTRTVDRGDSMALPREPPLGVARSIPIWLSLRGKEARLNGRTINIPEYLTVAPREKERVADLTDASLADIALIVQIVM